MQRTSSADTDHTVDDPYQLCKRCHRHDPGYELETGRSAVTWGAKESRSEVQLLTDRILIREKANGAVQFLSRDGKNCLWKIPSEPRLLLDSQTWNFFVWDKNERLKSKGVLTQMILWI